MDIINQDDLNFDCKHIWHPYTSTINPQPCYPIISASGCKLKLADGRELVDGMSSWWCAIHGYNHPELNKAAEDQLKRMSHVMFGGITHKPAIELCKKLVLITHENLTKVFLADSGSVAIEISLKMAFQYWHSLGIKTKKKFITFNRGYHGDTFGAMSVSDPNNGMHSLYSDFLPQNIFVGETTIGFYEEWRDDNEEMMELERVLLENHETIAAFIIEPIAQGAGGMRFYNKRYLAEIRNLCNKYNILLILDEIAVGFGRTGKLFAYEHAGICPDIMCIGKLLTGGYLTMSGVLTTNKVATTVSNGEPKCFMHGPTFMANPLACSIALKSVEIIERGNWKEQVHNIEMQLKTELLDNDELKSSEKVAEIRVLGAIGVVELKENVSLREVQRFFVDRGVWIRPFGKLIYIMPPYTISSEELSIVTRAMTDVILKQI
jgi:adenosylmethionine-8-amino-7-oxononanoate aminotransferase